MGLNQQHTRIDTLELKAHLYKKIGQQRAGKYFNLLNKLFSLQLSKSKFDKICIRTIGRENLPLHNRLISSILKNGASAKVPPPTVKKLANSLNVKVTRNPQRGNLQSLYGDAFPLSPRKSRSPRDRRSKDRPSPLGPNGSKVHHEQHQSPTELHSLGSRPPVEVFSVEDGEEVVSGSPGIQSRSPVTAPFGISMKTGQARKTVYFPYKVPLKTFGATMLCIPPAFLLILVMCLASARTFLVTGLVLVLGFILYPAIIHAKKKNWAHFMSDDDVHSNDHDIGDHENPTLPVDDETEVSLLSDLSSSKMEKVSEIFPVKYQSQGENV